MVRNAFHVVVALLLWVIFIVYWQIVIRRPMNPETETALVSLGVLSFLTILYLNFWVFHNIRLSKRLSRRRLRRRGAVEPIRDYLGRWVVVGDPEALRLADYIEVDIRKTRFKDQMIEEKVFRTPPLANRLQANS